MAEPKTEWGKELKQEVSRLTGVTTDLELGVGQLSKQLSDHSQKLDEQSNESSILSDMHKELNESTVELESDLKVLHSDIKHAHDKSERMWRILLLILAALVGGSFWSAYESSKTSSHIGEVKDAIRENSEKVASLDKSMQQVSKDIGSNSTEITELGDAFAGIGENLNDTNSRLRSNSTELAKLSSDLKTVAAALQRNGREMISLVSALKSDDLKKWKVVSFQRKLTQQNLAKSSPNGYSPISFAVDIDSGIPIKNVVTVQVTPVAASPESDAEWLNHITMLGDLNEETDKAIVQMHFDGATDTDLGPTILKFLAARGVATVNIVLLLKNDPDEDENQGSP